ncbi:protein Daple-like [Genypterus blacodes]|uniref:protein Daple-like n=1 Tax=Genypterus blacodes TaxID=154954 RepID=UPI003F7714B1
MESKELYHQEQKLYIDKLNALRRQKEKLEEKIMDQYKFYDPTPKKRSQWSGAKALVKLIKPRKESSRERGGERDKEAGRERERAKSAPDIPLPAPPTLLPPENTAPPPQRAGGDLPDSIHDNHTSTLSLGPHSPALTPISRGLTERGRVHRSSSDSVNAEEGHGPDQSCKALSSTPSQLSSSMTFSPSDSRLAQGPPRRPRGRLFEEDSRLNTSDSAFGHHGNTGGRPVSADVGHDTSSSNSSVNCRDSWDRQARTASLSSDDVVALSQSQHSLTRSSTLLYDHTPQKAQPQCGGGVRTKTRSSSPGSEMVTLEQFLNESNLQSPPVVSTGSREDLTHYFTRSPAPSTSAARDQATPTSYVTPTVQPSNQRPGQSVKPSPRQPVGQSPASAQRTNQSLSRTFSLASADLLRSNGPDSYRGNDQSDAVIRRQGGGVNGRERPLSARLAGPSDQHSDANFINPPIHHSSSLNLQTERYAERERERERGRTLPSQNGPPSSSSFHHRAEVAMVTPVRAVPAPRPDEASEQREGPSRDSSHLKTEGDPGPPSAPASPDPNNDPQTVWYEYGCV